MEARNRQAPLREVVTVRRRALFAIVLAAALLGGCGQLIILGHPE
ncbi:MAG: hypothetical protein V4610_15580 [Pseudomonadota bacterium]